MNLLDLANRPAAWVLQQWCDRYLALPPDASFAVQLSSGTAHLRDVSLKAEPFNHQLTRYGLKLTQGHVSQGELFIQEWSRLKVCIELDTLSLLVQCTPPVTPWTGAETTEGMLSMIPMHALVKWFMMNLKIRVRHVIVHFEAGHDCTLQLDLHGVSYERTTDEAQPFSVMAQSVELSLTDPSSRESVIHRCLNVEQMTMLLGTNNDDRLHLDFRTGNVRLEIHPDIAAQLLRLLTHLRQHFLNAGGDFDNVLDEAASMVESVFYDAESISRSSSVHSDISDCAFFECEEHHPLGTFKRSIVFNCEMDRLDIVLHSSSTEHEAVYFSLCLETMDCRGIVGDASSIEASVRNITLTDRSTDAGAIVNRQLQCSIPEVLQSLMMSMEEGQTSYLRLGFTQMTRCPCLSLMTQQTSMGWSCTLKSEPVVFWGSCASVQRLCRLLQSFCLPSDVHKQTSVTSLPRFTLDWEMAGVFGALDLPKCSYDHIPGLLLLEMKSDTGISFLKIKESRETRRWLESIPIQLCVMTLSVSELKLHHCPCEAGSIIASRCIASCIAQPGDQLSTGHAATLEITRAFGRRPSQNLSNLAYQLIDAYSQHQDDGFKERTLSRVEYEGKCVHSADWVIELLLGYINVEMCMDDMEVCMDTVLNFWRPSKMADQMMTETEIQSVVIINTQRLHAQLKGTQNGHDDAAAHGIDVEGNEMDIVAVGGVQCKTISTLAVTVGSLKAQSTDHREFCHIGANDDIDGSGIQFFQISELDYRNAKFKQWTALQQQKIRLHGDDGLFDLQWIPISLQGLILKNQERIRTDVEVEQCFSMTMHDICLQYDASTQTSLICAMERGYLNIKNFSKAMMEALSLDFLLEREGSCLKRWLHEERLEAQLGLEAHKTLLEMKNTLMSLHVDPDLLSDILQLLRSFPSHQQEADNAPEELEFQGSPEHLLNAIHTDAFSSPTPSRSNHHRHDSRSVSYEEDEDGFILVDDTSNVDSMRASHVAWLDDAAFQMRDDYIHIPQQQFPEGATGGNPQSDDTKWCIRVLDLSLECYFGETDMEDYVMMMADGVKVVYSNFHPGSVYQSRWSVSIQELDVVDKRQSENGRQIMERLRSQLRTVCSRQLKQQKTMTFPLIQFNLETVFPDVTRYATTKEKRCQLTILPLRLRLSHSFTEFCKRYLKALPSSPPSSSIPLRCMSMVSAFYVVVDYRPRSINLERLQSGRTGELINMVEWEEMEFLLNEMKVTGIQGWDNLLGYIVQNWTYDIRHSQRHMVTGFPALGMVRRMSPAAQDVARAAMSSIKSHQPIEQDVRGARLLASPSLSRAMTELGRVFSLEVLNLCAHGTGGMHLVFDGADAPPSPVNAREGYHRAKDTLRAAAQSVIADPIRSARSGEGVGVAMTKALWAVPKALLAPASAATTVLHGTLRSACDALDTDKVFNS